jgi:hypothetical protein
LFVFVQVYAARLRIPNFVPIGYVCYFSELRSKNSDQRSTHDTRLGLQSRREEYRNKTTVEEGSQFCIPRGKNETMGSGGSVAGAIAEKIGRQSFETTPIEKEMQAGHHPDGACGG